VERTKLVDSVTGKNNGRESRVRVAPVVRPKNTFVRNSKIMTIIRYTPNARNGYARVYVTPFRKRGGSARYKIKRKTCRNGSTLCACVCVYGRRPPGLCRYSIVCGARVCASIIQSICVMVDGLREKNAYLHGKKNRPIDVTADIYIYLS